MSIDMMYRRHLIYFSCLLILPMICSEVTLKTIYQESEEAMANSSVKSHMEVVAKYYFTHERGRFCYLYFFCFNTTMYHLLLQGISWM